MDEPLKLNVAPRDVAELNEFLDYALDELRANHARIAESRERIQRAREETKALGEETREIIASLRKAA